MGSQELQPQLHDCPRISRNDRKWRITPPAPPAGCRSPSPASPLRTEKVSWWRRPRGPPPGLPWSGRLARVPSVQWFLSPAAPRPDPSDRRRFALASVEHRSLAQWPPVSRSIRRGRRPQARSAAEPAALYSEHCRAVDTTLSDPDSGGPTPAGGPVTQGCGRPLQLQLHCCSTHCPNMRPQAPSLGSVGNTALFRHNLTANGNI
jgi:hypothetical protein